MLSVRGHLHVVKLLDVMGFVCFWALVTSVGGWVYRPAQKLLMWKISISPWDNEDTCSGREQFFERTSSWVCVSRCLVMTSIMSFNSLSKRCWDAEILE